MAHQLARPRGPGGVTRSRTQAQTSRPPLGIPRPAIVLMGTCLLPREVEGRCLQKDPDRRFQHMADVKVELNEIKEESDS